MKKLFFPLLMLLAVVSIWSLDLSRDSESYEEIDFPPEFVKIEGGLHSDRGERDIANLYDASNISSGSGKRKAPKKGASTNHKGTDYRAPCGTPVPSRSAGTVTMASTRSGYGKVVAVKVSKSCRQIYAHLSKISVKKGAKVTKGQLIGKVGNTGISTGCHLHYESCSKLYAFFEEFDEMIIQPEEVQSADMYDIEVLNSIPVLDAPGADEPEAGTLVF